MYRSVAAALLLVSLSGCASHLVRLPAFEPNNPANQEHAYTSVSRIGQEGYVTELSEHVRQDCRDGHLAQVEVRQNAGQLLLTILTFGLHAPARVAYYCTKEDIDGQ